MDLKVWKTGNRGEKKKEEELNTRGIEVNNTGRGMPTIQINLTRTQYALLVSALAGTMKEKARGVAKLIAFEMNRKLMNQQKGETDQLSRINDKLLDDLEENYPELHETLDEVVRYFPRTDTEK